MEPGIVVANDGKNNRVWEVLTHHLANSSCDFQNLLIGGTRIFIRVISIYCVTNNVARQKDNIEVLILTILIILIPLSLLIYHLL